MPEAVKAPPVSALRSIPISKDARTAFEKFGVDIGKLDEADKQVAKTADQIADRQESTQKLANDSKERSKNSSKRAEDIYNEQSQEFEKSVSSLSKKREFNPEQTEEIDRQKERHLSERVEAEKHASSVFEEAYESAVHKLGRFEVDASGQALDLAVGIQRMFDQFVEASEKKLAAASPEQREAVLAEIRREAEALINKVTAVTTSMLAQIDSEQKKISGEVEEDLSVVIYSARMRNEDMLSIQSREDIRLIAELKLNPDFSRISDAERQKIGFDGMSEEKKRRYYFDNKLSKEEKIACCDPEEVLARANISLKLAASGEAEHIGVKGPLTEESISTITKNAEAELARYKEDLAEDAYDQCLRLVHRFDALSRETVKNGEMGGVNAADLDMLMRDSVQKVVVQDIEARKRQLGDHGVRHIAGNIRTQEQIFDVLLEAGNEPTVTARERLMAAFIQVNHDMGYTSAMAVAVSDTFHKEHGQMIFDAQKDKFLKVFTEKEVSTMSESILTHDKASIDWKADPVNSAIRVADNLALYDSEKLPTLFRKIQGSIDILLEMKQAADAKDLNKFDSRKEELRDMVMKSGLSPNMKRDLCFAVDELQPVSPKFTLGMLAGDRSDEISFDKERGCINITIIHDKDAEVLARLNYNELAVRQVAKFAESMHSPLGDPNQTAFDLKDEQGQVVIHVDVEKTGTKGTFGERTLEKIGPINAQPAPVIA